MKKFLATILALVYLTSSAGATLHLHYCMDKLVAWYLSESNKKDKACPYCGMPATSESQHCGKQASGCCKDELKQVKLEGDQKIAESSLPLLHIHGEIITPLVADFSAPRNAALTVKYPVNNAPPRTGNISLFILNCIFRI